MTSGRERTKRARKPAGEREIDRLEQQEQQLDLATGEMLNVLDNPDDGELYETGDASDFAGERERRKPRKR